MQRLGCVMPVYEVRQLFLQCAGLLQHGYETYTLLPFAACHIASVIHQKHLSGKLQPKHAPNSLAVCHAAGGSEVVPLDSHEIETELSFLAPKPGESRKADGSSSTAGSFMDAAATSDAGSSSSVAGGFGAALSKLVSPLKYAQYWLDHHHGSYAQELEAAALRGVKQQLVGQRQQQQQQQR